MSTKSSMFAPTKQEGKEGKTYVFRKPPLTHSRARTHTRTHTPGYTDWRERHKSVIPGPGIVDFLRGAGLLNHFLARRSLWSRKPIDTGHLGGGTGELSISTTFHCPFTCGVVTRGSLFNAFVTGLSLPPPAPPSAGNRGSPPIKALSFQASFRTATP